MPGVRHVMACCGAPPAREESSMREQIVKHVACPTPQRRNHSRCWFIVLHDGGSMVFECEGCGEEVSVTATLDVQKRGFVAVSREEWEAKAGAYAR
jgi:hypothetical protein